MTREKTKEDMNNLKGSKDGSTWEEMIREGESSEYNRFSNLQYIRNLTLLKEWCGEKIKELTSDDKRE